MNEKFRKGDYDLEDKSRPGRPPKLADELLQGALEENPFLTTRELGDIFQVSPTTISTHISRLGYVHKYSRWVPHKLSEVHLTNRITICTSHITRLNSEDFIDRIITADEKWIVYDNGKRHKGFAKKGQSLPATPKPEIHQKKAMLCIWWNSKGPVHFELLPKGKTLNAEFYCQQLDRVAAKFQRKDVIYLHDNARPHTAEITKKHLLHLGWETLEHPPYSPDLAPSDYYLFRSLQHFLNGKTFESHEKIHSAVDEYANSKTMEFFRNGIFKLPDRWRQVIEKKGDYIDD
jgi:histone-lysine N-methyltransferase SETMAR